MLWEQHLLTAEGCVPLPISEDAASLATPRWHTETQALRQTGQIVKVCPAPTKAISDVWRALKQGKRLGPDPTARDGYGRVTMKAWLAGRLAELSPEEQTALLRAAASEDPPCPAGLSAVLGLVNVDVNAYLTTSEGLYSLPALLLYNGGIDNEGRNFSSEIVETLRLLRDAGVDLKLPAVLSLEGELLQTLAHQVVHNGHGVEVLQFLGRCGAPVDVPDRMGDSPLFDAVRGGECSLVQALIQLGADVHNKHKCGDGLLHTACRKGNLQMVQQLLRLGMAPNDVGTKGWTPLLCAGHCGRLEVVQLLHRHGANVNFVDASGRTAFSLAFRARHEPVVSYLRACGVDEHLGGGRTSLQTQTELYFKRGKTLPQTKPEKHASRRSKRTTPMRERAERAGVLDRYRETPPGLRERAESGSRSAKKELTVQHKHNHQVVDRAEVAARPDSYEHDCRLQRDAQSHRKRKLLSFLSGTV